MVTQVRYNYADVLNFYFDDLFDIILGLQKPLIASYEFLRKKHAGYRFRKLLELKHISKDKKEKILLELLECLPDQPSGAAYRESYDKILEVFSAHFGETMKLLDELSKILSSQEQDKIFKILNQKNVGIISSVRKSLSETILDSDEPEKVMVIDQALVLVEKLIEESLAEKDIHKELLYSAQLLMLILRIEAIKRGLCDYGLLYEDIGIVARDLKKPLVSEIPSEALRLLAIG